MIALLLAGALSLTARELVWVVDPDGLFQTEPQAAFAEHTRLAAIVIDDDRFAGCPAEQRFGCWTEAAGANARYLLMLSVNQTADGSFASAVLIDLAAARQAASGGEEAI